MAKIVFIGAYSTLGTTEDPLSDVRRFINPDNIVAATLSEVEEGWVWDFEMLENVSLTSMAFDDYEESIKWATENQILEMK